MYIHTYIYIYIYIYTHVYFNLRLGELAALRGAGGPHGGGPQRPITNLYTRII